MSGLVLRQNLSVADRAAYYTSIWSGEHSSSFSCSQARGWLTDLELVGTEGDKWSSVKVHKLVVLPVFPSLTEFLHENQDAKIVFPDVPIAVIETLIQLIYTGECQLSPVADVVAILRLANTLGLFIPPPCLKVYVKEFGIKNTEHAVRSKEKETLKSVQDSSTVKSTNDVSKRVLLLPMTDEFSRVERDHDQDINGNNFSKNKKAKDFHPKFSCEHCDFRCRFWVGLEEHANTVHKNKKFHCEKCGFETTRLKNVRIHNKHVHVGKGNLICEVCGFKAKTVNKLAWHEKHLHRNVLSATKNEQTAVSKTKSKPIVKKLLKKTLRVKRPLPVDMLHCHVCDFKTFYKKSLVRHVLKFHGIKIV